MTIALKKLEFSKKGNTAASIQFPFAGVVGFLGWWSVKLDPISMITIIMSIGFSVEFTAHITYGFVIGETDLSSTERTIQALEMLAWPVFQGALSTVIGVTVLAFIDSYMVLVFFKTIFLVISFGALHALLFLPVALSETTPLFDRFLAFCHSKKTVS